ncbi:hypothetical protein CCH79_00016195 [Gambusia affinis]|uniref:Major facilitator superfamily (MFS) profile domain-containing protein n=1 Tax=Gambusia affinis TaxID=33528 RepID=A0A315VL36_GAMAF|nr:hypothetical protein CCH79_00016195 [Gambusia affinis]
MAAAHISGRTKPVLGCSAEFLTQSSLTCSWVLDQHRSGPVRSGRKLLQLKRTKSLLLTNTMDWTGPLLQNQINQNWKVLLKRTRARVTHAVVVIFLEFFAWGLLTTPMLKVLHETFPQHTFLMNGLVHGVKGFLSFLSAPLIGALSDTWGRKSFLLITVFFTCAPIPFMRISPWWYFALIAVSGTFAVTFSVIFAYVADVTEEHERSTAYGLVSATFAASLVTSPAIGAYLSSRYGDSLVVLVATVIAVTDIAFVFFMVPESLPDKMRLSSWGFPISWEQADPFASLRRVGKDSTVLLICVTVFLSYLPEAGQYSSFFLYLKQVIHFSPEAIAAFIAMVGILSIVAQTVLLSILMRTIGKKNTVLLGLGFQLLQLGWYAFGSEPWMMWAAGTSLLSCRTTPPPTSRHAAIPGPPFLFGACAVVLAMVVAFFIPENLRPAAGPAAAKPAHAQNGGAALATPTSDTEDIEPLLQDSSM